MLWLAFKGFLTGLGLVVFVGIIITLILLLIDWIRETSRKRK